MNRILSTLAFLTALSAAAQQQNTSTPDARAGNRTAAQQTPVPGSQTPTPPAQFPMPGAPNAGQAPVMPQTYPTASGPQFSTTQGANANATAAGTLSATGMTNNFQPGNFGLAEVQTLLQSLQANIEQALPVLSGMTVGNFGVDPRTGLPNQLVGPAARGLSPASFVGNAGTNVLRIDPQNYHRLVVLQNSLQQSLLSLRDLNNSAFIANAQQMGQTNALTPTGAANPVTTNGLGPRILQNPRLQPVPGRTQQRIVPPTPNRQPQTPAPSPATGQ